MGVDAMVFIVFDAQWKICDGKTIILASKAALPSRCFVSFAAKRWFLQFYFLMQTATPSRIGSMVVNRSGDSKISLLNWRMALVVASGLGLRSLPLQRTLSVIKRPPLFKRGSARRKTRG